MVSTRGPLGHHAVHSNMSVRTSDVWTRPKYVTSKMTVETTPMKSPAAQIAHLRVIVGEAGDKLPVLTTLTGGGRMDRHQVLEQAQLLTTPWERPRYIKE